MGTASCRVPELPLPGGLAGASHVWAGRQEVGAQACFPVLPVPLDALVSGQGSLCQTCLSMSCCLPDLDHTLSFVGLSCKSSCSPSA